MTTLESNNISFLQAYPSLEEALMSLLGCTRSYLKKRLPKKELVTKVAAKSAFQIKLDVLNKNQLNPEYLGADIFIIYEDEELIALNKPAGIHAHALSYEDRYNCLSFLRQKGHFQACAVGSDQAERGLLYRLDKGTSGLIVFFKKQEHLTKWRESFNKQVKQKVYFALVNGHGPELGNHDLTIKASGKKGAKMRAGDDGQFVKLEILEKQSKGKYTLLKIKLLTGARHQIRVQLSHLGFPIVGDELYGGECNERLMLHAHQYIFNLTSGKSYSLEVPLPQLFSDLLNLDGGL